jgi:hypothetical protein
VFLLHSDFPLGIRGKNSPVSTIIFEKNWTNKFGIVFAHIIKICNMKNTMVRLLFLFIGLISISPVQYVFANSNPVKGKDDRSAFSQYQDFTIKTMKVDVQEMHATMMLLKADSSQYSIKLEPKKTGNVAFSLSGIVYQSNFTMSNLFFRVTVTGYKNDEIVYPTINLDQTNKHIHRDNNQLTFQSINGSVPVWFHEDVDSIHLNYSNSHSVMIPQYLSIHGLRIMEDFTVIENPIMEQYQKGQNIMIAVDGSSSIEKKERKMISNFLGKFVRSMRTLVDSSSLSLVEYGSEINSNTISTQKKSSMVAVRTYKKAKNQSENSIISTNWSAVFEEAQKTNPDILIFITDGWSNWKNGKTESFSSIYQGLLDATNSLKSNGTRLIFVTLEMNPDGDLLNMLSPLLNGDQTVEHLGPIEEYTNLSQIDLIALENVKDLSQTHMENLFLYKRAPRGNTDYSSNSKPYDESFDSLSFYDYFKDSFFVWQ